MTGWLRDSAGLTTAVVALAVVFAAPAPALDDCGVGMYFNNVNGQCEPWAPVGVDFAPGQPVPVPVVNSAPVGIAFNPVPVGIGFDVGFGLNVPNIAPYLRVPTIGIPGVPGIPGIPGVPGVPGVHVPPVPDLHVPAVPVPDVRVPDVPLPEVRVPEVRVPEVHVPEVHPRR